MKQSLFYQFEINFLDNSEEDYFVSYTDRKLDRYVSRDEAWIMANEDAIKKNLGKFAVTYVKTFFA
jgi:hypothetical protein